MTDRDMFDTMTLTKIAAAFCSALLVLVLGGWIADKVYSPASHGEDHGVAWIETDSGNADDVEVEVEEGPVLADLLASADLEKGAKTFKKCAACHKLEDGKNGVGPHLYGVVNRAVGSVDGFNYSGSLMAVAQVWSQENLNGFLTKPSKYAPGTKMSFNGLSKPKDRANLIAYLETIGN
jgi:cytochrome c